MKPCWTKRAANCVAPKDGPTCSNPFGNKPASLGHKSLIRYAKLSKGPLLLTALDGLSHQEAGERLGLSAKAVEVKIYRARKTLRDWLKKIRKY